MISIDKSKPVAVTGGTGYIASWIVKYLIENGFHVKASVRRLSDNDKNGHLYDLERQGPGKLTLYEADLLRPGSFDELVKDCELVFHTASPFKISGVRNFDAEVIEPALQGTRNFLDSVNRTLSVKRVVLTASVASIYGDGADADDKPGRKFTPDDWNTTSTRKHQPYSYSKTVAEKEAWSIAGAQNRWDLVTVHPAFVLGPSLSKRIDSTSIDFALGYLKGRFRMGSPDLCFGFVDVRDVAKLHIEAGVNPSAKGRYIAVGGTYTLPEIAGIIKTSLNGKYPVSKAVLPNALLYIFGPLMGFSVKFVSLNAGKRFSFDTGKTLSDLNFKFTPVEKTLEDHFDQIRKDGLA